MKSTPHPQPALLPVEPTDLFPIEAIKSTLLQEKFDARPYSMAVGDFEVAMITPTLKYRAERESEIRAAKEKGKRNRKSEVAVQDSFRPLDDLKNWEVYVGEYKPVLLIRVTPKLRETGGSVFLRSLAAAGGAYNVPAKLRFKADFYKMTLTCGSKEITPILPGKIAHVVDVRSGLVNATDATYEGFYEFPADSIGPSCGQVTLTVYGEKDPNKAFSKKMRDIVRGSFTPNTIQKHLVLLSVCQTCKYMGVDFLDFLRSGEKDVRAFAESRRDRWQRQQINLTTELQACATSECLREMRS